MHKPKSGRRKMTTSNEVVSRLVERLDGQINPKQIDDIKSKLYIILNDYDISEKTTALTCANDDIKQKAIRMFFVSKKIEGCTDATLTYYGTILRKFFTVITVKLDEITADDVRLYLAKMSTSGKLSKTSQDNELRVLKSFFKWCFGEGYINKIPTLNIKNIKQEKRIKKPFSEMQIEILRQTAAKTQNETAVEKLKAARDLAIVDVLFSTGVRVSELVGIDISDIQDDEIIVFGKGEKERSVYLNAKSKLSIERYLALRNDNEDALFISSRKPYSRLSKGGVERTIREIGKRSGVKNAHPHRFRRTAATLALNRGMPIEQVSQMLGHEKIETTTIYARSDKENVKASHKKYVV